jgi:hypothetical protein
MLSQGRSPRFDGPREGKREFFGIYTRKRCRRDGGETMGVGMDKQREAEGSRGKPKVGSAKRGCM